MGFEKKLQQADKDSMNTANPMIFRTQRDAMRTPNPL
jgi:hypothetical protein